MLMDMKVCKECSKPFKDIPQVSSNAFEELGNIYIEHSSQKSNDQCTECREKYGEIFLMGFQR
jgi:hypothetical protein